ncbi:hypothetical protein ACIBCR_29920 [Micromonospora echinospora]
MQLVLLWWVVVGADGLVQAVACVHPHSDQPTRDGNVGEGFRDSAHQADD